MPVIYVTLGTRHSIPVPIDLVGPRMEPLVATVYGRPYNSASGKQKCIQKKKPKGVFRPTQGSSRSYPSRIPLYSPTPPSAHKD